MPSAGELILELLETNISVVPVAGLCAWLGSIWSKRIAEREAHINRQELARLTSELQAQRDLLGKQIDFSRAIMVENHRSTSADQSQVLKRQLDAVDAAWKSWLKLRVLSQRFITVYQMAPISSVNAQFAALRKYFAPYTSEELGELLTQALNLRSEIDSVRPFLPVQIYEHLLVNSTLYLRLGLKLQLTLSSNHICEWCKDTDGTEEFSVRAAIDHASKLGFDLPEPKDDPKVFQRWVELLEAKLAEIFSAFVNGSLDRSTTISDHVQKLYSRFAQEQQTNNDKAAKTGN